jgi:2-polyprenyl-3-methyl-5-hydroxy-6-metoxy-1,4-benzoquinol methylase
MNRKQRRATLKQSPSAGGHRAVPASDPVGQLFAEAARHQRENKLNDAARVYKRLLLLKPDHAEAHNNLGVVLQAQGKLAEASVHFARALTLMPQLFVQSRNIATTLFVLNPQIDEAFKRVAKSWPNRPTAEDVLGPAGITALAGDPILTCMLQSTTIRNIGLERLLTVIRLSILHTAMDASTRDRIANHVLDFYCALAKQCFINDYVFATTAEESKQADRLKADLIDALGSGAPIAETLPVAVAMYFPLHSLPDTAALLERAWPAAIDDLLNQQVREPAQERQYRDSIPRLTPIEDDVSQRVRQQYEENPYPRWVHVAGGVEPIAIDQYLRNMFPTAAFQPLGKTTDLEILVAGCGTGQHPINAAQLYLGARLLAVDLSLSSLCYAKRKTPLSLTDKIEYAQADILKLASIGRSFDVVDASGVLHHMADPFAAWRILLKLLRPGGLMHLGFYSELGRRDVVAARAFIAERGYGSTPEEIRRCRQDLLETPLAAVANLGDFFSTSECRDLLFHVQEIRLTIPTIRDFIAANALRFIGFEFTPPALQQLRELFAANGWSMTDLDKWHAVETQYPNTFSDMYQLWVQKS